MSCPHCKSSNRQEDESCYNCQKPLHLNQTPAAWSEDDVSSQAGSANGGGQPHFLQLLVAVVLTSALGAALGIGLQVSEVEMPFFLEEVLLGVICSVGAAFAIGKLQEMPEGILFARLGPAAGFGALVGLSLFCIWWSFDPSAGFPVIGAIAGFCSSLPIAVSFGLLGGESRPVGLLEFGNVIASFCVGAVLGVFLTEDVFSAVGGAGVGALIPCFVGGRINLYELIETFSAEH